MTPPCQRQYAGLWLRQADKVRGNHYLPELQNLFSFMVEGKLSVLQNLAMVHIIGALVILLSLYSLISVFFGNKIIDYFKLESRFPKLVKFIKLRQKFQVYYLAIDFAIITFILISEILLNLYLLLY